jgi:anti-sigma factor (TIGR02949 family)
MKKIICFINEEELNLYLDRELPSTRQAALDEHVIACAGCSARYYVSRRLKEIVRNSGRDIKAPAPLRSRIMSRLEDVPSGSPSRIWEFAKSVLVARPFIPIGVGVAAALVFISLSVMRPRPTGTMELINAMVHEHDEYIESFKTDRGIVSTDPDEVSLWLAANTTSEVNLSKCGTLPSLAGACALDEEGLEATCLFFDNGDRRVSLFVLDQTPSDFPAETMYKLKDKSVMCGNNAGNNYVIWADAARIFILVSKLPEESLIRMAEALI